MVELRVGCIGAGNMGGALLGGLLDAGAIEARHLCAVDLRAEVLEPLRARGVAVSQSLAAAVRDRDVVILAVKPQGAGPVLAELTPLLGGGQLVLSLMAGVTTASIAAALGRPQPVVRAMPQTLVRVGAAATAVCAGAHATRAQVEQVRTLFEAVGSTVEVTENQMDSVTGLSGSGPAYVYTVIEALADAGVNLGLSREVSLRLAAQTAAGAGRMVLESGLHPAVLRDQVTSPGGTTSEGLRVLEERGLRAALIGAVRAAAQRARELG